MDQIIATARVTISTGPCPRGRCSHTGGSRWARSSWPRAGTQVFRTPCAGSLASQCKGSSPWPLSAEGRPALPLAPAVLETSAFPPICDICRPSGSVRDKLLQCGLSVPGQPWPWPGALDPQRSEARSLGSLVWAATWGFDICGALTFVVRSCFSCRWLCAHLQRYSTRGVPSRRSWVWAQGSFQNRGGNSHEGSPRTWRAEAGQDWGVAREALA